MGCFLQAVPPNIGFGHYPFETSDGQDWDGIMHVNPQSKRKAFISVYNPLDIAIEREIEVPLYYTGLTNKAIVKEQDKNGKEYSLARDYSISLKIRIPAKGYNWYIIE